MPLYEYRCARCNRVFEVLQRFSDEQLKVHPDCGGKVEKLISASGFHLKGSGWYATDYAKAGSKGGEKGEKKESGDSKPATETTTLPPPAKSKPPTSPAKPD